MSSEPPDTTARLSRQGVTAEAFAHTIADEQRPDGAAGGSAPGRRVGPYRVVRELGRTDSGELLPQAALVAIHWSHRTFALVVFVVVAWAAFRTFTVSRSLGTAILLLLITQFALGVANVAFNLPLALAAAHNAGAAALLVSLVVLNFFAFREHTGSSP